MSNARELAELGLEVDVDANGTVFNESGDDRDFRVESANASSAIYVDAGNDRVHIGTSGKYSPSTSDGYGDFRIGTSTAGISFGAATGGSGAGTCRIWTKGGSDTLVFTNASSNGNNLVVSPTEIVINDSGHTRDFRVESATDSHALFVDASSNRVGIGTSAPDRPVHIRSNDNAPLKIDSADSTQASIAYALNGVDKWYAGADLFANGAHNYFIYDAATSTTRMLIDGSGNLLVGHTSAQPYTPTEGTSTGISLSSYGAIHASVNASVHGHIFNRGSGSGSMITFRYAGADKGTITTTSSGTTYATTSDRRLKTDIQPITNGTEKLMAMNPVTHKWKADPHTGETVVGFIAQEMQEIVPEAVSGDPDGEEMMSMDYGRITPVLVAALQDAHKKIEALEERLAELEAK